MSPHVRYSDLVAFVRLVAKTSSHTGDLRGLVAVAHAMLGQRIYGVQIERDEQRARTIFIIEDYLRK